MEIDFLLIQNAIGLKEVVHQERCDESSICRKIFCATVKDSELVLYAVDELI